MATAHVWPFDTVRSGTHYDSSPVTAPGAVTPDGGFFRVTPASAPDWTVKVDRYPEPTKAELVTLWRKGNRMVLAITADGKTQDFYMPPGRLAYLIKEVAEQLAESTILK